MTDLHFKNNFYRRGVAFVTAICFFVLSPGSPTYPTASAEIISLPQLSSSQLASLKIPDAIGRIDDSHQGTRDEFVWVIQDAHALVDAQHNLQQLIRFLQEKAGNRIVGVEGLTGKLDATLLRAFPDEFTKKKITEEYLGRAELSGIELAAIYNPQDSEFEGIEDWGVYERNFTAYVKADQVKDKVLERLKVLKQQLDTKRPQVYTQDLNAFHEQVENFLDETTGLIELARYLVSRNDIRQFLEGREELSKFLDSVGKDKGDASEDADAAIRQMAESFRKKFSNKLSSAAFKNFTKAHQDFLTGQTDAGSFLKRMIETAGTINVKPRLTSEMKSLLGTTETLGTLKGTKLFEELNACIKDMKAKLMQTPAQKTMGAQYEKIRVLKSMASLELMHDQLDEYRRDPEGHLSFYGEDRAELDESLKFYEAALDRDRIFLKNLSGILKKEKQKTAVMVVGGFHAEGVKRELRDSGYSYAVLMPRIESLDGHESYHDIMTGTVSYKSYIKSSLFDAFSRASTIRLVAGYNNQDFKENLKTWRDQVIRDLSKKGRIAEAGEYTRYIDMLYKIYADKFGGATNGTAGREDIIKVIEQELNSAADRASGSLWAKFQDQFKKFADGLRGLKQNDAVTVENVAALMGRGAKSVVAPNHLAFSRSEARSSMFENFYATGGKLQEETLEAVSGARFLEAARDALRTDLRNFQNSGPVQAAARQLVDPIQKRALQQDRAASLLQGTEIKTAEPSKASVGGFLTDMQNRAGEILKRPEFLPAQDANLAAKAVVATALDQAAKQSVTKLPPGNTFIRSESRTSEVTSRSEVRSAVPLFGNPKTLKIDGLTIEVPELGVPAVQEIFGGLYRLPKNIGQMKQPFLRPIDVLAATMKRMGVTGGKVRIEIGDSFSFSKSEDGTELVISLGKSSIAGDGFKGALNYYLGNSLQPLRSGTDFYNIPPDPDLFSAREKIYPFRRYIMGEGAAYPIPGKSISYYSGIKFQNLEKVKASGNRLRPDKSREGGLATSSDTTFLWFSSDPGLWAWHAAENTGMYIGKGAMLVFN